MFACLKLVLFVCVRDLDGRRGAVVHDPAGHGGGGAKQSSQKEPQRGKTTQTIPSKFKSAFTTATLVPNMSLTSTTVADHDAKDFEADPPDLAPMYATTATKVPDAPDTTDDSNYSVQGALGKYSLLQPILNQTRRVLRTWQRGVGLRLLFVTYVRRNLGSN